MPAQPKAPGARARRNKDQNNWRGLPAEGKTTAAPACPESWSEQTCDWWEIIWRSPMATIWLESDVPALVRLGNLLELPKQTALIIGEIRQIEDRFGLSPKSRRMLQWLIEPPDESEKEEPVQHTRRLRAV